MKMEDCNMKQLDELLSIYSREIEILNEGNECYEMMGKLLDKKCIKKNVEYLKLSEVYIYGGGYLGIQLYYAIKEWIRIISVVDRQGAMMFDIPEITVIDMDKFKKTYQGQSVIVTPIKHYREIIHSLEGFVPTEKMIFLSEIVGEQT